MKASEARRVAEFSKMSALEGMAKTCEFKNNRDSIYHKIKSFCELGDLNCYFDVTEESSLMIETLTYYFRERGYDVKEILEECKKHLIIKW